MKIKKELINGALVMFAIMNICAMIMGSVFNGFEFHIGYQILLVSVICSILRYIFYSEDIIQGKSYGLRNILFFTVFFPLLFLGAMLWNWFPFEVGPMITFVIIFLLIGGAMSLYFHFKFKREGFKYTKQLSKYKQSIQD